MTEHGKFEKSCNIEMSLDLSTSFVYEFSLNISLTETTSVLSLSNPDVFMGSSLLDE